MHFGNVNNDSASDTYDEYNHGQPMKEITVRIGPGEENATVDDKNPQTTNNNKRGYELNNSDPEKKRRKV